MDVNGGAVESKGPTLFPLFFSNFRFSTLVVDFERPPGAEHRSEPGGVVDGLFPWARRSPTFIAELHRSWPSFVARVRAVR